MTVVPVYNLILTAHAKMYLQTDAYTKLTDKDPEKDEKLVFLMLKQNQAREDLTSDSFYPIGVSGYIADVSSNGYVEIDTTDRVDIGSVTVSKDGDIELEIRKRPEIDDLPAEEERKKVDQIKAKLAAYVSQFQWGPMARGYISQWTTLAEAAAGLSMWLVNTNEEKYQILAEDSRAKRADMIEKSIYEFIEMSKVTNEAENKTEQDYQKAYRKSAIQKQMEYLQNELDQMDPESISDVRKFEKKIDEAGMNEDAEREARKVLGRLKQEGPNSAESGMLYDYLDFVTSLSWKKEKPKKIDLKKAQAVLDKDHFGLKKVKKRIIEQIAVMNLKNQQSGSILLFVGAPGTGKTSIGKSIAKALKRKYVRVSLGGIRDEADIRGHRRTYIGAMPGRIMDAIHKCGTSNPVMVLDEVDKIASSYNGDPASALLEVLDPEQNNTFTDHYMNVPYDLSDVLFVCTANTLDTIPEPLLNRMEVIQFSGYTADEKLQIAKKHLIPKAMKSMGLAPGTFSLSDSVLKKIISDYTAEAGVRGLKKRIDTLCRGAAVDIVTGDKKKVTVHVKDLREKLDLRPITHDHVLARKRAGVVTGLAWTQNGGEILFIESLLTPGKGNVTITGQLGDVMKESVEIAISLAKYMFPKEAKKLEDHDLHIHVPEGAVPKDGPSAGITLTTAICSLITGRAVSPEFAMTGEVSLRGVVTAIGGLPEKLMAAMQAGVKTVFIPKDNVEDLRDVAPEVRKKLNIVPVSTVREVLKKTGVLQSKTK